MVIPAGLGVVGDTTKAANNGQHVGFSHTARHLKQNFGVASNEPISTHMFKILDIAC